MVVAKQAITTPAGNTTEGLAVEPSLAPDYSLQQDPLLLGGGRGGIVMESLPSPRPAYPKVSPATQLSLGNLFCVQTGRGVPPVQSRSYHSRLYTETQASDANSGLQVYPVHHNEGYVEADLNIKRLVNSRLLRNSARGTS